MNFFFVGTSLLGDTKFELPLFRCDLTSSRERLIGNLHLLFQPVSCICVKFHGMSGDGNQKYSKSVIAEVLARGRTGKF
jgi:hypothetical protein